MRLQMAVTSLIASLNPAIVARQNTGIDSEEVRAFCLSTSTFSVICRCSPILEADYHRPALLWCSINAADRRTNFTI